MRVAAIDLGDVRTGVAFSDLLGRQAGEALVLEEWNRTKLCEKLATLFAEKGVTQAAVGKPLNMDGTEGPKAKEAAAFAALLETETNIKIVLWDERRTTIEAHNILSTTGRRGKKRKQTVDAVAASLILEGFLASLSREN